jgi:N-methylhydantoinase A/oxoprolinase/acetone carboxylase beta subunit
MWTALQQVDVESIGAGGGAIGWVDARGLPRAGPQSAGSVPGPACYGRGGIRATVTDALVVLGYIDPDRFLGGDFKLDSVAARAACAALGERIGLDLESTAWGIRRLALAGMVKATRGRTGMLGLDLRRRAFISFGGSGWLFTPDLAVAVGAKKVLVPELASVLSAFGAATTDIRRERIRSAIALFPLDPTAVARVTSELARSVLEDLAADGVREADRRVYFEADLRFSKQISEIAMPLPVGTFDADAETALLGASAPDATECYQEGVPHPVRAVVPGRRGSQRGIGFAAYQHTQVWDGSARARGRRASCLGADRAGGRADRARCLPGESRGDSRPVGDADAKPNFRDRRREVSSDVMD